METTRSRERGRAEVVAVWGWLAAAIVALAACAESGSPAGMAPDADPGGDVGDAGPIVDAGPSAPSNAGPTVPGDAATSGCSDDCEPPLLCDPESGRCVECVDATDCPGDGRVAGPWGECTYDERAGECGERGLRSRNVTVYECIAGTCSPSVETETETDAAACDRTTEGASCGPGSTADAWGPCMPRTADVCDAQGTQSRSVFTSTCRSEACATATTTESRSCTRETTGCTRIGARTARLPPRGNPTSTTWRLDCPSGSLAVGISIKSAKLVDSVAAICARLASDGTLAGETITPRAGGGSGNGPFEARCPAGTAVVGLTGAAGSAVDRLGVRCAPVRRWATGSGATTTSPQYGGSGGTAFSETCPVGYVLRSIDGTRGRACSVFTPCHVIRSVAGTCVQVRAE